MNAHRVHLKSLFLAFLLGVGSLVSTAWADPFYGGISFGRSDVDEGALDDSDTGWKLFGGYRVNPNFAAEAAWVDLGDFSAGGFNAEADGFSVQGVGFLPLNAQFSLLGKLGIFFWDVESNIGDDDGSDIFFGIGGQYEINQQVSIRGEWERYDLDDTDVDLLSIGVVIQF